MTQFLQTRPDITAWLDHHQIQNYTLVLDEQYDFIVDVNGTVNLSDKNLHTIPIKFNHVTGSFFCSRNHLKSLKGFPCMVDGSFSCDNNELTSLEYAPQNVGGNFSCGENKLTTLKGSPQKINGDFWCADNQLTSLLYGPNEVNGNFCCNNNRLSDLKGCPPRLDIYFGCTDNQLTSLEFCPQKITGNLFYCENNPLLGESQNTNDFKTIYQTHLKTLIELEKKESVKTY